MPSDKKPKIVGARTKFKKQITPSAREYLLRQAKDPYVKKAQEMGYRSRAAFKLIEIDDKYRLIKPGMTIVDLGAAPGGWSQVLSRKLEGNGNIIAIDKQEIDPISSVDFMQGDFTEDDVYEALKAKCPDGVDIVLSDMAPFTTGTQSLDHLKSMGLAELAEDFAMNHLKPGGHFLCKIFQGGEEVEMRNRLRKHFDKVGFEKPAASRSDSKEIFVLARGFKAI